MKIIISPAKKMNRDPDSLPVRDLPIFLEQTQIILQHLKKMSAAELKTLWKCNDSILNQNVCRLENMDLYRNLTPSILAYEGIQYQYMAPGVFSRDEFEYIQDHLRILSGFYGILKPFDGVTPYRLEMQARFKADGSKDLYDFWGRRLTDSLFAETDCILNLASKEYSLCISRYLPEGTRFLTCIFGEEKNRKVIEKGTLCKMARGEMVRWLAENCIDDPDMVRGFDRLNYQYSHAYSSENTYVFLKKEEKDDSLHFC